MITAPSLPNSLRPGTKFFIKKRQAQGRFARRAAEFLKSLCVIKLFKYAKVYAIG
jgi:hypothetical protein